MSTCPITGEELPPGRTLSMKAIGSYRNALLGLQDLLWDLDIETTRQARHGPANRGSRSAVTPLPFDDNASEATTVLKNVLIVWTDDIARRRAPEGTPVIVLPKDWGEIGAYLREAGKWIATQEDGLQIVDEIMDAIKNARRAIDPSRKRRLRVGLSCEHEDDNRTCCGQYEVIVTEHQQDMPDLVCNRNAEHRIEPLEWQRALRKKANPRAAAKLIASIHPD